MHPSLFNVPTPEPFEAVTSWLPRLALSQGTDLRELARFLGVPLSGDIDRECTGDTVGHLRSVCGLSDSDFYIADRIMSNMAKVTGSGYLAIEGKRPRFRYCAPCIQEMRVHHYPIQWRFVAWRRCPLHNCLLEDRCPHCHAPLVMPTNMFASGPQKDGVGSLNRCLCCAGRLTDVSPVWMHNDTDNDFNEWSIKMLGNGRALLSALYLGFFNLEDDARRYSISSLGRVRRHGGLPTQFSWLSPDNFRAHTTNELPAGPRHSFTVAAK